MTAARWRARRGVAPPPPVAETTLQTAVSDLTAIHALLPRPRVPDAFLPSDAPLPPVPSTPTSPTTSFAPASAPIPGSAPADLALILRVSSLLTIPYIVLTYFIRLRVLVGLAGSVVLTHRAPWAAHLRAALWRSAHLRWALYRLWALLSGQPLPSTLPETPPTASIAAAGTQEAEPPAPELRFLFTVHENQRWWMGLDWTAALLPGERPSWCTPTLQPVSPPAAFALPPPSTTYMPAAASPAHSRTASRPAPADAKGPADKDAQPRVRRTARWAWAEPEWRVLVRRDNASGPSARVERPLPALPDSDAGTSSGSRIFKAAAKMRGESGGAAVGAPPEPARTGDEGGADGRGAGDEPAEPVTDADGWVYADNKWEGQSGRGGMGKVRSGGTVYVLRDLILTTRILQYTRYRRWTRIAVLSETVELVEPGETGIVRHEQPAPSAPMHAPSAALTSPPSSPARPDERRFSEDSKDAGNALRQRLRAAVKAQS